MKLEKRYRYNSGVGGYCLTVVIEGEPDLVEKTSKAIDKESESWKYIKQI